MEHTVKTRVLIISDTHCASLSQTESTESQHELPFRAPLPAADVLIHCGDMTYIGKQHEYQATLDMLRQIDAPVKLVIAGNHDISLDQEYVVSHVGKSGAGGNWKRIGSKSEAETIVKEMRKLWLGPKSRATKEGVTFLDEGVYTIGLQNGARLRVYASPFTPAFCDYGYSYRAKEDRFNNSDHSCSDAKNIATNPIPSFNSSSAPIDVCITHGPAYRRLDQARHGTQAGCPHLLRALMRARPLIHCFGHIHEGWGAQRITWSEDVDTVATATSTIAHWQRDGWKAGIAEDGRKFERLEVKSDTLKQEHSAFVDLSESGAKPLRRGDETLFINASIMDVRYNPTNAPWVIDLDLLKA